MIKRRSYRLEHGDGDNASDSSSSSSGSEIKSHDTEDANGESDSSETSASEVGKNDGSPSASSGYDSENSSGKEVSVGFTGYVSEDDDRNAITGKQLFGNHFEELIETVPDRKTETKLVLHDASPCIMKCKSVFKCKICPRIVCLNEDTMRAHLKSKRHSRSEKLLKEGRLKAILNSDGEIENQEIVAEKKDPIPGDTEDNLKSKQKGRNRWSKGSRNKRTREEKRVTENGAKKRRKDEKGKA